MRRPLFVSSLTFLLWFVTNSLLATECSVHPEDSLAIYLTSTYVDTTVSAATNPNQGYGEACFWRNTQNQTSAVLKIPSIYFSGSGSSVDSVATSVILNRLRVRSVVSMIEQEYLICTTSPDTVRVYQASSVVRSGSGLSTSFAIASESAIGYYDYEYRYPTSLSIYPEVVIIGSGTIGNSNLE
jgi:hypothetical protein